MTGTTRGTSIVEALVGAGLAGIAVAGLAGTAALATASLNLARDTGTAVALASERLEALRAGRRADGDDRWLAPDGTLFSRAWTPAGGRGRPVRLSTRVAWRRRVVVVATEAWP